MLETEEVSEPVNTDKPGLDWHVPHCLTSVGQATASSMGDWVEAPGHKQHLFVYIGQV